MFQRYIAKVFICVGYVCRSVHAESFVNLQTTFFFCAVNSSQTICHVTMGSVSNVGDCLCV
jgi:hypothetical protein